MNSISTIQGTCEARYFEHSIMFNLHMRHVLSMSMLNFIKNDEFFGLDL
jgi:hypothetical protein